MKLGRKRPEKKGMRVHLRDYLKALPSPPSSVDYSRLATSALANVYDNDSLGCCVVSAGYHVVGVETGNAGNLFTATDAQIIADYGSIGGYVPGDPSTDNGCDERTAFQQWINGGFADGTKLTGWAVIDGTNPTEIMTALFLFENLFFGMELPDAWISPFPSASGFTWDVAGPANPSNGHAVCGVGYTPLGVQIDTWGMIGTLTFGAIATYATAANNGELYVLLTPDQLSSGQIVAPNGVAWSDLLADLASLNGTAPPQPPPPVPPPDPTGLLSLSDAQAALARGWQ